MSRPAPNPPHALGDADVPAYWRRLGLPGLVDCHVHFLPPGMLAKVWAFFDNGREHYGLDWPVHYRTDDQTRVDTLRGLGVLAFPGLVYPHKPGMAEWLNGWAAEFAAATPGCVPSATFYPEPGAPEYVRAAVERGARLMKVHLQVGAYDPRDPLLDPVWGLLAEAGIPVVSHCGGGPLPGRFTGPGPIGEVLARHPRLALVIAHMGMPEYVEHLDLAATYANVHLDTTMVGTGFTEAVMPLPAEAVPRMADLGDRIVLGSDFPNIPYPYADQISALDRLGLGDEWLRAVLYHNGARLLRMPPTH
jgi:hypothetical protein